MGVFLKISFKDQSVPTADDVNQGNKGKIQHIQKLFNIFCRCCRKALTQDKILFFLFISLFYSFFDQAFSKRLLREISN